MVKNLKKTNKKVYAIVQARIGSKRLPGKVLINIVGKPMLWHIINRVSLAKRLFGVILAIPDTPSNDTLEKFAQNNNLNYFRGKEEDVLSRFYNTAKKFKCNIIVRITADNPLVDPNIIDLLIAKHLNVDVDYTSNNLKKTFPVGLDVEVFNFVALKKAHLKAKRSYDREHVTPYIYSHPKIFKLQNIEASPKLKRPEIRLTVDIKKELQLVKKIYQYLYVPGKIFYTGQAIDLLNKYPLFRKIKVHN